MKFIEYLRDLPLVTGARLTKKGRPEHWLHPIHGPLPDLIGQLAYGDESFIGAVWPTEKSFVVAVELVERERGTPSSTRGRILQTFRWTIEDGRLVNVNQVPRADEFEIGEVDEEDEWEWRCEIYRQLLIRSVELTVTTTVGGYRNDERPALSPATDSSRDRRASRGARIPVHRRLRR